MNQIISKSLVIRLCLISFILLCSVFTNENAFSQRHWHRSNASMYFNSMEKNCIIINLIYYDFFMDKNEHSYLNSCDFEYSEDGVHYNHLMSVRTRIQESTDWTWIILSNKKRGEQIQYLNPDKPNDFRIWPPYGSVELMLELRVKDGPGNNNFERIKRSELTLKWDRIQSSNIIKYLRLKGVWRVSAHLKDDRFEEVYKPVIVKSNSNSLQNTPSVLKPEISNNVKVTGETDAINVTGTEPGKNITIYTVAGVEVKSVVANHDLVNIKLPTNQIYIVKAGQARYKVAL